MKEPPQDMKLNQKHESGEKQTSSFFPSAVLSAAQVLTGWSAFPG